MKQYWEIPGPSKAPHSHCIAFYKYDGSNIRCEWSRKRGWYKFGSRKVLIDDSSSLGEAIEIFKKTYADDLERIFIKNKVFRNYQNVIVFCEFFGSNSFAGWHDPDDEKEIILIDVNIHKRGIMPPRDFIKTFRQLKIAEIVYEGNFSKQFIQDVKNNKYPVKEGVVAKGILPGRKSEQHSLWMVKCKTSWWFDKLKQKVSENPEIFKQTLQENLQEQK